MHSHVKSEQIAFIVANVSDETDPKEQVKLIWKQAIQWAIKNEEKYQYLQQYKYSPYKRKHKKDVDDFRAYFMEITEKGIQKKQIKFLPGDYVLELTNASVYGMIE